MPNLRLFAVLVCVTAVCATACSRPCDDARQEAAGALSGYHIDAVAAATSGALVIATGSYQTATDARHIEDAPAVAELIEQMQTAVAASDWSAVEQALETMGGLATAPGWDVSEAAVRHAMSVCQAE